MRRLAVLLAGVLLLALPAAGGAQQRRELVEEGERLYGLACASCHGSNGRGVGGRLRERGSLGIRAGGPPLLGVGSLAADFYLRTGYMPLRRADEQPQRQRPRLGDEQIEALTAYVASLGGGPPVPRPHPERGDVSEGLKLFTDHCAGCHQVVGRGGAVTGNLAPVLDRATAVQIAEAVRIGPYVMPRFSEAELSERELDSIIRYVEYAKDPDDRGGWAIGRLGPVPEGLVTWLIAAAALVLVALLIGERARE